MRPRTTPPPTDADAGPVTLTAGDAAVTIDPDDGCRLTSLRIAGYELLSDGSEPSRHDGLAANRFGWGSFVMAPWAGRIRDGRARWDGQQRDLDTADDRHALHGLVYDRPWSPLAGDGDGTSAWQVEIDGERWFAPLVVTQRLTLADDALTLHLEVAAPEGAAPATVGWHPWFRRRLTEGGPSVQLDVPAAAMLLRDADGIATPERRPPPPPPWDDAFVDLAGPVRLRWDRQVELVVTSDAATTVVFTEPSTVVCVEPQSGPPDEVHHPGPRLVAPDEPLRLTSTWRWRTLG